MIWQQRKITQQNKSSQMWSACLRVFNFTSHSEIKLPGSDILACDLVIAELITLMLENKVVLRPEKYSIILFFLIFGSFSYFFIKIYKQ